MRFSGNLDVGPMNTSANFGTLTFDLAKIKATHLRCYVLPIKHMIGCAEDDEMLP